MGELEHQIFKFLRNDKYVTTPELTRLLNNGKWDVEIYQQLRKKLNELLLDKKVEKLRVRTVNQWRLPKEVV